MQAVTDLLAQAPDGSEDRGARPPRGFGRRSTAIGRSRARRYTDRVQSDKGVSGGGLAPTFSFVGEGRAMDAEALVRPMVEQEGFEFVEAVHVREDGRKVLRVVVDRPGGVDLDALSELTVKVSSGLETGRLRDGPYQLRCPRPASNGR